MGSPYPTPGGVAIVGVHCQPRQTGPLWDNLLADQAHQAGPRLAAIILTAWASIIGYLSAEIFGSLTQLITGTDQLYRAHLHTVMLGMGYDPGLTAAATRLGSTAEITVPDPASR